MFDAHGGPEQLLMVESETPNPESRQDAEQQYNVKLEFFDNAVDAVAKLAWSSASQAREIIPQSRLYPASG